MKKFNADSLIRKFGGLTACAKSLRLTPSAIVNWRTRGEIPSGQWLTIIKAARDNGFSVSFEQLSGGTKR